MSYRRTAAVLGLVAALGSGACSIEISGDDVIVREERHFTVAGEPDVRINTFDGSIQVRSWDKNEVLVQIEKHGRDRQDAAALSVMVTQQENQVQVEAAAPAAGTNGVGRSRSVSLVVSVPRAAHVTARSGDGSIDVEGVRGRFELHSGDGSLRAAGVKGEVIAQTGDGSIHIDGELTRLRASTQDGAVSVQAAAGSVAETDWEVSSGDGSITLDLPARFDAEVDAQSGDGSISITGLANRSQGDQDNQAVRGRLGAGGRTLKVRSGDGSIRIAAR
jgi:hypothetical protein